MDEDWRNIFGILMLPLGAGPGGGGGPEGSTIHFVYSHVAYQIEVNKK